jgi:predicted transcriptional regulator
MRTLGELERAVMEVLWSADGPLTARAVAQALPARALAQTTVLTVLSRLEKKGVVARNRSGRAHRYAAVASREDHVAELMRDVLGTAPDKTAALARFVGSVSEDEAAALAEALERARQRRSAVIADPADESGAAG